MLDGDPLIVGPGRAATVIEKAGRDAVFVPSLTEMVMPEYTPTFEAVGVPESCPVLLLNVAQTGRPEIEKVRAEPLGCVAVGVKL